jgi:16S rRNA (cytidine1402-2'-O)-methyltransferase
MPGTLYVVATPIGNLEDVSFRALRILREVSVIAAEDTRRTARLLQHYSISTPTTSLHQHNEGVRAPVLLARLEAGESVALVSDAGTPIISDPGRSLVSSAHTAGIRVEPIPGASALVAALSACGLPGDRFTFMGFPPSRGKDRVAWFKEVAAENRTVVIYEAPHRIRRTLSDLIEVLGDRVVGLGRELTKVYEQLVVGPISEHLKSSEEPRGEYTLVIAPPDARKVGRLPESPETLRAEFSELLLHGSPPRAAVRLLATKYAVSSRYVYSVVHQTTTSGASSCR